MNIAAMLERQILDSDEFSKRNFGLKLGSDFPEIAREALKNERVCQQIFVHFMMQALATKTIGEQMVGAKSLPESIAKEPLLFQPAMEWFYWGIQVGRQLEKESAAALQHLEEQP